MPKKFIIGQIWPERLKLYCGNDLPYRYDLPNLDS